MNTFANILATFGSSIGIDGLCPDENGVCSIQFDEVIVNLECSEDGQELYAYSQLCPLPDSNDDRLALYGFLLELNSLFKGTDGGVLGIEPALRLVTYTNRLAMNALDATELDTRLGRHVDTVESLRASIAELRQSPVDPSDKDASWTDTMLRI